MYAFYDPNHAVVPYRIVGATDPVGQTDNYGSMDGLPAVYVDNEQYPDVVAHSSDYKIDPVTLAPIHLTVEEQQAIIDSIIPPEPTTEERLVKSEEEGNKLRQKVASTEDMLNGLVDYLSTKSII